MSDATPAEGAPKRNNLMLALVGVNMLGMLAIGAYVALRPAGGEAAAGGEGHAAEAEEEPEEAGPMIELDSLIVNLQPTAGGGRYLKVTAQLEVASEEEKEHVLARVVAVKDGMITYLSAMTSEQVSGPENMEHVREHILELARAAAGEERVRHVYFTEYLVQ